MAHQHDKEKNTSSQTKRKNIITEFAIGKYMDVISVDMMICPLVGLSPCHEKC